MAKRSFTRFVEQELGKFPHFLIFAVLEWVLIILLFVDGFLSYLANEFSKFFDLQLPCLLCTRIDHVLVHRNSDFYYNDSICETHKRHVSSLAYCHNHKKLSDIRQMCEACLLSFATERESDCGTYKSLVGILHKDLECFVEDDHQILSLPSGKNDEITQMETSCTRLCSCCHAPLKAKSSKLKGKVGISFSQAPAPSPRAPFSNSKNEGNRGLELPHVRYSELKFISDNENELPEDEDGSNRKNPALRFKEDVAATVPLLTETEELNDDVIKTPSFVKGNKFFGIPLTDSANNSPRWGIKIARKSPLEKTDFAPESVEGTLPEGGDGDSILYSLKRQVRLDRKSLMALYMELDEERSASAVAANNAMAMITRLQAEKAAMQMEALQYQRMMEEQAEYDQEALQAANDLLVKREEEIKNLETELEAFKDEYGCLKADNFKTSVDESDEEESQERKPQCDTPKKIKNNFDQAESSNGRIEGGILSDSLKAFGREKAHFLCKTKKSKKDSFSSDEEEVQSLQSSSNSVCREEENEEGIGNGKRFFLTRELSRLGERVKALEEDSGLLEHASETPQKHSEGSKILTEISRNLMKLQNLITMPFEENDA